jgi:hypothetical protein
MAFLPAYQKKHGIVEVAVIVIGNACSQISKVFGTENVIALDCTEMDELVQAIIFTREENCIIAHHDRPYTDNIIKRLDKHFLSFIDYYRCAVYSLTRDTIPVVPTNLKQFKDFGEIPKGKSVIMSPYAKSMVELPNSFWESLVSEYSGQGYSVYTNVSGNESPISGTKALNVPIAQIKAAAEYAGAFIGIRSGLCDVLLTADCRKTVVFPDCYYSTTPHKVADFFALPGWGVVVCGRE